MLLFDDEPAFHTRLLQAWTAFALVPFILLFFTQAPYGESLYITCFPSHFQTGKFAQSSRWSMSGKLGWMIQEVVSPLSLLYFYQSQPDHLYISLWLLHYMHRTFIYTWNAPSMNSTTVPIVLSAVLFNLVNGYLNGTHFRLTQINQQPLDTHSVQFLLGLTLFAVGMAVNINSDYSLFHQRRQASLSQRGRLHGKKEKRYVIPRGGLFEYVSASNYAGEIVEWLGYAVMTQSPAAWSFFVWTVANLGPRAYQTHQWYKRQFGKTYPAQRRALIPYLL